MKPEDESGAETAEPGRPDPPLFPRPSGHTRWLMVAAILVAAALAVWRCG
jgi:hypothetical protein